MSMEQNNRSIFTSTLAHQLHPALRAFAALPGTHVGMHRANVADRLLFDSLPHLGRTPVHMVVVSRFTRRTSEQERRGDSDERCELEKNLHDQSPNDGWPQRATPTKGTNALKQCCCPSLRPRRLSRIPQLRLDRVQRRVSPGSLRHWRSASSRCRHRC